MANNNDILNEIHAYLADSAVVTDRVIRSIFKNYHDNSRLVAYIYSDEAGLEAINEKLEVLKEGQSSSHTIAVIDEEAICQHLAREHFTKDEIATKLPLVLLVKLMGNLEPGLLRIDTLEISDEELAQAKASIADTMEYLYRRDYTSRMQPDQLNDAISLAQHGVIDELENDEYGYYLRTAYTGIFSRNSINTDASLTSIIVEPSVEQDDYSRWNPLFDGFRGTLKQGNGGTSIIIRSPVDKVGRRNGGWGDSHYEAHYEKVGRDAGQEQDASRLPLSREHILNTAETFSDAFNPDLDAQIRVIVEASGAGKSSIASFLQTSFFADKEFEYCRGLEKFLEQINDDAMAEGVLLLDESHKLNDQNAETVIQYLETHPNANVILLCHDANEIAEPIRSLRASPSFSGRDVQCAFFGTDLPDLPQQGALKRDF